MNEFDLIIRFKSDEDSITLQSYIIDHLLEDKLFDNLQMWDFKRSEVLSIVNLRKENAELKAHCKAVDEVNEKMKCCGNCKKVKYKSPMIDNDCTWCTNLDKWEVKE